MDELKETEISCPYCGECISVLVDPGEVGQQYIEDCQVCCKPIVFVISEDAMGRLLVSVQSEDDA